MRHLQEVTEKLANDEHLNEKYHDHSLIGNWQDCRECHIKPDWLLIYQLKENELILVRTGSHSDLF
jgi:mRNA interferase YafQ